MLRPKLIVASCPHCMNAIGNEYKQIGGSYFKVMHHTQYLESLVADGRLDADRLDATESSVTYLTRVIWAGTTECMTRRRDVLNVLGQ